MFQNIGTPEILIGILLLVIIFGGNKVGEIARGLGEATREIKKAQKNVDLTKEELKKEPVVEDTITTPKKKIKKNKPLQKIKK